MALAALTSFLVLLMALNHWGWQLPGLGLVLGSAYLVLTSWLMGARLKALARSGVIERLVWGGTTTVAVLAVVGTVLFYLNAFNAATALVLLGLLPWLGSARAMAREAGAAETKQGWSTALLALMYLALVAATWFVLAHSHTSEAIRTPWVVVPGVAFALYGAVAAAFLTLAHRAHYPLWLVPLYGVSLSLLPLVYAFGYGFDPHIHMASEQLLAATGTISPKPLYYLGQYVVVVAMHFATGLPVAAIDTWLVPASASLVLPFALTRLARALGAEKPWLLMLPALPLLMTVPAFTYTTPQGLAYLWAALLIVLLALRALGDQIPRWLPWLVTLAALVTQPITGLPLVGVTALWWFMFEQPALAQGKRWLKPAALLTTALGVPLAFIGLAWLKPATLGLKLAPDILGNVAALGQNMLTHLPFLPRLIDATDATYVWARPLALVTLLLAAWGWHSAHGNLTRLRFCGLAAALCAAGYLVMALGTQFPNLPANEQDFYTARLLELAFILLWPLAMLGTWRLGTWVAGKCAQPAAWVLPLALLATSSWYLTYPRFDLWHHDTAYNTTPYDQAAVELVAQQAGTTPYVVLANQAVAAAAISTTGFDHYVNGSYYYPVPTGANPLYGVYLNAAERGFPTREVVAEAARLTGVTQVYLVLNRYWANFDELSRLATTESNANWSVGQGRLAIFRYDF